MVETISFSSPLRFSNLGALVMLSIPPAIIALYSPALILLAAIIAAFREEPQTLLMVVAAVEFGSPAPNAT